MLRGSATPSRQSSTERVRCELHRLQWNIPVVKYISRHTTLGGVFLGVSRPISRAPPAPSEYKHRNTLGKQVTAIVANYLANVRKRNRNTWESRQFRIELLPGKVIR